MKKIKMSLAEKGIFQLSGKNLGYEIMPETYCINANRVISVRVLPVSPCTDGDNHSTVIDDWQRIDGFPH